jgi:hypothetical protein
MHNVRVAFAKTLENPQPNGLDRKDALHKILCEHRNCSPRGSDPGALQLVNQTVLSNMHT